MEAKGYLKPVTMSRFLSLHRKEFKIDTEILAKDRFIEVIVCIQERRYDGQTQRVSYP